MKRIAHIFSLLLLLFFAYISFNTLMPDAKTIKASAIEEFSTERALNHVQAIAKKPHFVGTAAHTEARNYIYKELEALGLETQVQEGFIFDQWRGYGNLVNPQNVVARWKGTQPDGKALLLLSHYDSAPHSLSYGASDAASGVAAILEGLRAYKASGKQPKNDIIILISDAEELGLYGARLFVKEHPWTKNVGVAFNFEARGSGGPSNMIVESNNGNAGLIKAFKEAAPEYPVATSLMYSIYKLLPNDTDSTVLRENGDIEGFFFAFIDDHYDYHTVNDNIANLDRNSLAHQGSYLMPLLDYFSQVDLDSLKSKEDHVYFNNLFFNMVSYPFSWIWPMLILVLVLFIVIVFDGLRKKRLIAKEMARGFGLFLITLISTGVLLYLLWELIKVIYPGYNEILPVFIYNGHWYIAAFTCLSLGLAFGIYGRFTKPEHTPSMLIAPIVVWILINVSFAIKLQGAAYFIIPVYFALIALYYHIKSTNPSVIIQSVLCLPAILMLAPLLRFLPVGLGSDINFVSGMWMVLIFGLLYTVFGLYRAKKWLGRVTLVLGLVLLGVAHTNSSFTEDRPRPNSLIYYAKDSSPKAYWATYDKKIDSWVKGYLGENPDEASQYIGNAAGSKYNSPYTFATATDKISLTESQIRLDRDTIFDGLRNVAITIVPKRKVHQMRLYAEKNIDFKYLCYNGQVFTPDSTAQHYKQRATNGILSYYLSEGDSLVFEYIIPVTQNPVFTLKEFSYDLTENPNFTIAARPKNTYPKQFIPNDAVVVERTINPDELKSVVNDTIN